MHRVAAPDGEMNMGGAKVEMNDREVEREDLRMLPGRHRCYIPRKAHES